MASQASTSVKRVPLNTLQQWDDWSDIFKRRAVISQVWEIVQPGSIEPFPQRPEYPERPIPPRAVSGRGVTEAASAAYEQAIKSYPLELAEYRERLKDIKEQESAIRELATLIVDTVSPELQRTHCFDGGNIREWYTNLESACSSTTFQKKEKAIQKYKELVDTRQKIKNPLEWLTKWEVVMAESIKKNVAMATTPASWFNDLIDVLTPCDESFINAYKITIGDALEDETLNFRTVANKLKWHFSKKAAHNTRRVAKGTFGPTFAEPENEDDESAEPPAIDSIAPSSSDPNKKNSKRSRRATQSNNRSNSKRRKQDDDDQSDSRRSCKGCDGWHDIAKCYYVFPSKAPTRWKPNPTLQQAVAERIKDKSLAGLIKKLEKEQESTDE